MYLQKKSEIHYKIRKYLADLENMVEKMRGCDRGRERNFRREKRNRIKKRKSRIRSEKFRIWLGNEDGPALVELRSSAALVGRLD